MQKIQKRLRSLFVANFFAELMFHYAIFLPYMHHLGITATQIALYVIISNVMLLALEIPSGILADRWSRKRMMLIGFGALLIGLLIVANAHSFISFVIGNLFCSVYFAIRSGMKEAMVYDALLELKRRGAYEQTLGRLRLGSSIANVISSLLGAVLAATIGYQSAFYASCLMLIPVGYFLQQFKEPQLHRQGEAVKMLTHIGNLFKALNKHRDMRLLAIVSILTGIDYCYMQELDQLWPIALNLAVILYGPLNALLLSSQAVPSLLIKKLITSNFRMGMLGPLLVLSASGLFVHNMIVCAISEFTLLALSTTLMIFLGGRVQDELPSSQRSGVESAISTFSTLAFTGTIVIFSAITKAHSVFAASWVLVVVAIAVAIGNYMILATRKTATAAAA